MKISHLLEKIGLRKVDHSSHEDADDQLYSEAMMDNAVIKSEENIERFVKIKQAADTTNEKLSNGIARIKIVTADKGQIMASLVRGMKSGNH